MLKPIKNQRLLSIFFNGFSEDLASNPHSYGLTNFTAILDSIYPWDSGKLEKY